MNNSKSQVSKNSPDEGSNNFQTLAPNNAPDSATIDSGQPNQTDAGSDDSGKRNTTNSATLDSGQPNQTDVVNGDSGKGNATDSAAPESRQPNQTVSGNGDSGKGNATDSEASESGQPNQTMEKAIKSLKEEEKKLNNKLDNLRKQFIILIILLFIIPIVLLLIPELKDWGNTTNTNIINQIISFLSFRDGVIATALLWIILLLDLFGIYLTMKIFRRYNNALTRLKLLIIKLKLNIDKDLVIPYRLNRELEMIYRIIES